MNSIQLGAEAVMLLLKVMQLNAEAPGEESYHFEYSGGVNGIVLSNFSECSRKICLTHYIGKDYGDPLDKLFEFVENERDRIRQKNAPDLEQEGRTNEEV